MKKYRFARPFVNSNKIITPLTTQCVHEKFGSYNNVTNSPTKFKLILGAFSRALTNS